MTTDGQQYAVKVKTSENEVVSCGVCGQTFSSRSTLSRHMQLHTGQFKFYCDKCKKGYPDKTHFDEHMLKHQGLKYHFEYCSKQFTSKKGYQYHLSAHTGNYRFWCEECKKGFNKQPNYLKHIQSHC